ncbi:MAG: B3/B4 domain-containing protein [Candidatus Odinarchaeia archaeon]
MMVFWDDKVRLKFNDLKIALGGINNLNITRSDNKIEILKEKVYAHIRNNYTVEDLKNIPIINAYRSFYWKIKIDPTKTRPAGEALIRRILRGRPLPKISNVVDAYNLASAMSQIAISAYDADTLELPLKIRFANKGEEFIEIGGKTVTLTGKELIVTDDQKILSIYPHRDGDLTKITENTKNIIIIAYGAPGIEEDDLLSAINLCYKYITNVAGGTPQEIKISSARLT